MTSTTDEPCPTCAQIDLKLPNTVNAERIGTSEASIRRHRAHMATAPVEGRLAGMTLRGATIREADGSWYRYSTAAPVIEGISTEDLEAAVKGFTFTPASPSEGESLVVNFSDLQAGKTDFLGGTPELIARTLKAAHGVAEEAKRLKPREIVFTDPGDSSEGFMNTSQQRETNDLDMVNQIRVVRRLLLECIKILAPHAPSFVYLAVPSNHCTVRVAPKSPAGNNHNDWGLEVQQQIKDVCAESEALAHVRFVHPEPHMESLVYKTESGTLLGLVHGHQTKGVDKIGTWWQGQALGKMPVGEADILIVGHWHNLRVQTVGSARTVFVCPTLDNGSSWWSNLSGDVSDPGVLMFTTADGQWSNLQII